MRKHQVLWLLTAGLLSVSLTSTFGSAHAADPDHVVQLRETKLCGQCDLSGADLSGADLAGVNVISINLSGANLSGANLSGAFLFMPDLSGAILKGANLSGAKLVGAIATKANLAEVNLSQTTLINSNLTGAILTGANLTGADLSETNLSGAVLYQANLTNAQFEPAAVPSGVSFFGATGLKTLTWKNAPTGMILLRNAFRDAGMREQEREVTYAHQRTQRIKAGGLEGTLQYILFEVTSDWGMSPARPFWTMLGLIPVFTLLYILPMARPSTKTGVWRIWDKDRAQKDQGQDEPEQLTVRGYRLPFYALFFSVLSAFHIGWRELNVGSWIARLNPYEFTLKGTGWVRTVSGIQSLISVYLLALAVLTYFGRPFE